MEKPESRPSGFRFFIYIWGEIRVPIDLTRFRLPRVDISRACLFSVSGSLQMTA